MFVGPPHVPLHVRRRDLTLFRSLADEKSRLAATIYRAGDNDHGERQQAQFVSLGSEYLRRPPPVMQALANIKRRIAKRRRR